MATCQQGERVRWSGVPHDGKTVILLLREQLRSSKRGRKGAGREVVLGNGRGRGKCERLGKAWHDGVGAGCMGACIPGVYVPRCNLGHPERRTAGRGSCEGEGLLISLRNMRGALGGRHRREGGM